MRKLILTFALVLVAQMGMAQSKEAFKADVMKVLKVNGNSQMNMAKKQVLKMIPEAKHAAFLVEFEASMPAYYEKASEIYMQEYTHEEVKEMLKFYESPIGKKMSQKSDAISDKMATAAQEWGMGLQGMVMKYMQ